MSGYLRQCAACNGRGQVAVDEIRDLAAEVWQRHKNTPRQGHGAFYPQICAIKELRTLTSCSLSEAKQLIDAAVQAEVSS